MFGKFEHEFAFFKNFLLLLMNFKGHGATVETNNLALLDAPVFCLGVILEFESIEFQAKFFRNTVD